MPNSHPSTSTIAQLLRSRQSEMGLRQADAAQLCGVTPSVYSRWITARTLPSMTNLDLVAAFLEISRTDVLALMPDSYQMRASAAGDIDALRNEVAALRESAALNEQTLSDQIAELRRIVDGLTAVVERLMPTA